VTGLASRAALLLALIGLAAAPLGCLSKSYPEKRRYVFEIEPPVDMVPGPNGVLRMDRVRVSPLFERKGFVYRTGEATFETEFYNAFFAPPGVLLRKATLNRLLAASIFSDVLDATQMGDVDWILEGHVKELYADLRDRAPPFAVLQIEYTLLDARSPTLAIVFRRSYPARASAAGGSAEAIVNAWTEALTQVLGELEVDLRKTTSP
jgi:ABC-type uncharacterized transport system auxiliary subunit